MVDYSGFWVWAWAVAGAFALVSAVIIYLVICVHVEYKKITSRNKKVDNDSA